MLRVNLVAAPLSAVLALAACSSGAPLPYAGGGGVLERVAGTGAGKIKHIVYIVQENRSFDNLFQGYPGADTVSSGKNSFGRTVQLKPVSLADQYEIDHSAEAMFAACDGQGSIPGTKCKMDGFNKEESWGGPSDFPEYVYVPRIESKPYFDMAHEWVLADRMFQSQLDESFDAHQYIIAAQAAWSVNLPSGRWGCGGGKYDVVSTITASRNPQGPAVAPCYDYETLGDELDTAGLSWRFYASSYGSKSSDYGAVWSSYQAIKHIYGHADWKNVISPDWRFILDVRAGKLADFTWITPVCSYSDHVNCGGGDGPSWVAALVDTIGASKFWDTTAIFVQWDDWGGLYDHVPPPYRGRDGVGFRVPLLVISPYAKHDYVTHVPLETASVLKFAENLWGLDPLAAADSRANSPGGDSFDFSKPPRRFIHINAPLPPKFFIGHPDEYAAPDYE